MVWDEKTPCFTPLHIGACHMAFGDLKSHLLSLEVIKFEHYITLLELNIALLGFSLMYVSFWHYVEAN
jgi:hypothetical protein